MKLFVYSYREFDEAEFFQKFAEEYQGELGIVMMLQRWKMLI